MTILTATECRTINNGLTDGIIDFHTYFTHIGPLVKMDALVTFTSSEEVARHRVSGNLCQCAGNTQSTARHLHKAPTFIGFHTHTITHVGQLTATID